jgi:hypothetical protein
MNVGGKCGSTMIDRNFNKWMTTTFGDAYQLVDSINRGAGSEFMELFIRAKRAFRGTENPKIGNIGPIKMDVSFPTTYYRKDELSVCLTPYVEPPAIFHSVALGLTIGRDIMRSLFDPVIAKSDGGWRRIQSFLPSRALSQ